MACALPRSVAVSSWASFFVWLWLRPLPFASRVWRLFRMYGDLCITLRYHFGATFSTTSSTTAGTITTINTHYGTCFSLDQHRKEVCTWAHRNNTIAGTALVTFINTDLSGITTPVSTSYRPPAPPGASTISPKRAIVTSASKTNRPSTSPDKSTFGVKLSGTYPSSTSCQGCKVQFFSGSGDRAVICFVRQSLVAEATGMDAEKKSKLFQSPKS